MGRVRPFDDHIHLPAAAARAHQPVAPIGYGRLGAIALGHLRGVGLDLTAARGATELSGSAIQKKITDAKVLGPT
jgi:hypothetical protein